LAGRLHASDSLLTQKLVWSEDEKRFLTYKEVLSSKIGISWSTHRYKNLKLKLIDNSDEDIAEATREMMERLEGRVQDTEKDQKLQHQINSMYKKYSGYGAMGRIAKNFLEKADRLGLLQ
jgi:putative glycosyltransferase (TIGR04372 family)